MKTRNLIMMTGLGMVALQVHAQSSVTLYGLIDEGLLYNTNSSGKQVVSLANSNLVGNRWGLKGNEDLGGGLSAIFVLENGFNVTTGTLGQGGAEFGRQAYVGIAGNFGKITLGRQYDPLAEYLSIYSAAAPWASVYAAHPADLDNLNATKRTNNAIKFRSPDWMGFSLSAMYGVGGMAGNVTGNSVWSVAVNYIGGPLSAGVAMVVARDPNYSYWGTNPSANSAASTSALNMASPIISGYASARTQQIVAGGGTYKIGNAMLGLVVSDTRLQDIGSESGHGLNPRGIHGGEAVFDTAEFSFLYRFTPALQAGIAYQFTTTKSPVDQPNARYNQLTIGTDYLLSKRTDLYAVATYQRASGVDSTGKAAVAALASLGSVSSVGKQAVAVLGIRHRF
ncbi:MULTISPECIES: porin [Paraburkholderia]|uniref:Porin n=1 Tax=Paraburkholderia madseniana TaxID=2599607 RepID=A0AAP5ERH1_9BURK|nr:MULTISPECIES: porin [Paraburkholderia]MCX4149923.1 porin [Paraburkholderia madseniana]MDN7152859.1 porin [Paraburkholderia sp. WS6]MDQ6411741.1 porin [Paraburkholderia madseniana]